MAAAVVDSDSLAVGLFFGAVALVISALLAFAAVRGRRPAVLGVPVAVAGLLAARRQLTPDFVPPLVFVAVALLALGGLAAAAPRVRDRRMLTWAVYLPGAAVLAGAPLAGVAPASRVATALATCIATVALVDFERAHDRDGFALLLLPVSALVPAAMIGGGTIAGSALLGAVAPVVVMALPRAGARLGAPGLACFAGAYFWVVLISADDRPARFGAAFVGLGFLLFEPVHRFLTHTEGRRRSRRAKELGDSRLLVVLVGLLGQGAIAAYSAAVAARETTDTAILSLLPVAIAAVVLARAFVPSPRRFGRTRDDAGA